MKRKPWYQSYDPGINLKPIYLDMPLKEQFVFWVKKEPNRPYIYYLEEEISYQKANEIACKLANALIKIGIGKGDRVAITLLNMPEFVFAVLACLKIGAIIVPTNPRYTKRELVFQYKDSGVKTIVCLEQTLDIHLEIMEELQTIQKIIFIPKTGESGCNKTNECLNYRDVIHCCQAVEPSIDVSADDLALILYTSGTTGASKGCCITNANLIAVADGWKQMCQFFTDMDNYKVLCSTPMYHVHGFQTAINSNILLGGSMIILADITSDNILRAINKYEPNVWPAVPTLIMNLMNHPALSISKANKLQHIGCGAFPIRAAKMKQFESIVGVPIIEGYGASETSMAIASNPSQKRKTGSVGIPYPNVDCKVVDLDTGLIELEIGEIGELCFKGPQVIKEYWQNPQDTAASFRDGWWYSGDVGYMDENGFIFLVDRKKDLIICSGFNVYSKEVDEILNSHPKILEATVVGIPDEKRGETVKAYVVVKPGEELSTEEVRDFCRKYLTAYKVPTDVEFIDSLPRNALQKLNRRALRLLSVK